MRRVSLAALALALACAAPPAADESHGAVWGYVRLIPKAGTGGAGDSYADRRLRDAARFDYSQPTFAVVYAPGAATAAHAAHALALEPGPRGAEWRPAHAAIGEGDQVTVANHTREPQIVSAPAAGWLRELAPGHSDSFVPTHGGELAIHALGARAEPALVWVAPGAFALADAAGRYELRGLAPGETELRAWHPRLPPSVPRAVRVRAGEVARVDLEIGVDRRDESQP